MFSLATTLLNQVGIMGGGMRGRVARCRRAHSGRRGGWGRSRAGDARVTSMGALRAPSGNVGGRLLGSTRIVARGLRDTPLRRRGCRTLRRLLARCLRLRRLPSRRRGARMPQTRVVRTRRGRRPPFRRPRGGRPAVPRIRAPPSSSVCISHSRLLRSACVLSFRIVSQQQNHHRNPTPSTSGVTQRAPPAPRAPGARRQRLNARKSPKYARRSPTW